MTPQRRDRLRPWELLGPAALIAIVIGIVVFFGVRRIDTAAIWAGVSFIVTIVVFATLMLASNPEAGRRRDDGSGDEGPRGDDRPRGHD